MKYGYINPQAAADLRQRFPSFDAEIAPAVVPARNGFEVAGAIWVDVEHPAYAAVRDKYKAPHPPCAKCGARVHQTKDCPMSADDLQETPAREVRRARQGGCCGKPSVE